METLPQSGIAAFRLFPEAAATNEEAVAFAKNWRRVMPILSKNNDSQI
jgi:hypothetical protein